MIPRVSEVIDPGGESRGFAFDEAHLHIVCPWHGFEYDIQTGVHPGRRAARLIAVKVEEDTDGFMSPSEQAAKLSGMLAELRGQIERTSQAGNWPAVARHEVTNLLTCAVKLYAAFAEEADGDVAAIDSTVSTTEAMGSHVRCCERST